jgi:hypothetical protein
VLVGDEAGTAARAGAVLRAGGWRVLTITSAAALATAWAGADQATENSELRAVRDRTAAYVEPASAAGPTGDDAGGASQGAER